LSKPTRTADGHMLGKFEGLRSPRVLLRVDVPGMSLPTLPQWEVWGKFIDSTIRPNTSMLWWGAHCPLHDPLVESPLLEAEISFFKSSWRCERCNQNLRAYTLETLTERMKEGESA
jgi:hypothetical protein